MCTCVCVHVYVCPLWNTEHIQNNLFTRMCAHTSALVHRHAHTHIATIPPGVFQLFVASNRLTGHMHLRNCT